MPSSIDQALRRIGTGLTDVAQVLQRPAGARDLLRLLGWDLPAAATDIGLAALDLTSLVRSVESLEGAIGSGVTGTDLDAVYVEVGLAVATFLHGLDAVVAGFDALPDYLAKTDIKAQFAVRLLDWVIVGTLETTTSVLLAVTTFLGVTEIHPYSADPTIYQVDHIRRVVHWDRVAQIFGDIGGLLKDVYQWGAANVDPSAVVGALGMVLSGMTAVTEVRPVSRRAEAALVGHDVPEADTDPMTQLMLSITRGLGWSGLDVGVSLIGLRPTTTGGTDGGVAFAPYVTGTSDVTFPLTDRLSFSVDTTLDVSDGIALLFRAGSGVSIRNNLATSAGVADVASGRILTTLAYANADGSAIPLLTVADGVGLEAGKVGIGAGVDVSAGVLSAMASVALTKGVFRIDTSHLDSFLSTIIPLDVTVSFDLTIGWSSAHGFFIEGNASPHFDLSLNTSIGPFTIDALHIALTLGQPGLPLELSLDGSARLGPLAISVQRLGVAADLSFQRGNLGPANVDLGVKPPTGLGILLDAGVAAGGGFISFDPEQGRYAGVLDVSIVDLVAVKVIAVLDTKLANGDPGFSFLMIITFEFPPIQLGLGFTLSGVGGLGGINRTMVIGALQAGLRAHTLDNILFPPNPIADATRIISEIESFFPPKAGRYLFGPMLSVGWGTPTMLNFQVGVILEVPDPIRLAILGEVTATIPSPDFPLVSLKIQVLGTIDFGLQKLAIDGTMYDSYLLAFHLAGDMALRLNWGATPNFLASLGGFNPRFNPPPDVPALARLAVSLGSGSNPRLSASSYLAVTSNSLQFGANVDAYASAGGFSVHGFIGFDALFVFSPFSFEIDFSAAFDVSYDGHSLAGIQLDASLSGPTPWHLHGRASLHILFFSVSASLDLHWGDDTVATLPRARVLAPLVAALADPRNWSVSPPPVGAPGVSLRATPAADTVLVVQPTGRLQVREILVPLGIPITKVDNAAPSDGSEFSISGVTVNGSPISTAPAQEEFAIAQFTDMSDADKVSAPSYELFDAGISLGAVPLTGGHDAARTIAYQDRYIDDYHQPSRLVGIYQMTGAVHSVLASAGAAAGAATATTGLKAFAPSVATPISVAATSYLVASTVDLTPRPDVLATATTRYQAQVALAAFVAQHPGEGDLVQILPAHEVATV